ncbi:MAG: chromosome segregation protein SMC [Herbaspirillum sp.]
MRLNTIKLAGFKSFIDPVHIQVPGQLVGVVGPNGCGKSNIIDAVRWVLGESKASELRGESMQDVIFNGTTNRKPAGRASVELVFDNAMGKVAGQWGRYAEIAVRRVLTRDGTSSYTINNQPVRRRDIQDIFLGTGLGPRAYAIIGQGMISCIIEARPEDLRIFLEEAAGVSKYKERRRETENRLHDTRENLTRLEDILSELNGNLDKLSAQAAIARKFRELQADQEEKQQLLWLLRRNEARAEQEKYFRDIERAQRDLEEQTVALRQVDTELERMRRMHHDASDRLHAAQGHLYQTNSEIGSLEAQIRFVTESRHRLQSQLDVSTAQHDQWQRQGAQHQNDLAGAEIALQEQRMRVEQAQQAAQDATDELPALEQAWREAQRETTESRSRIMQTQQQIELESAHQRNACSILSSLGVRRERLMQEQNGIDLPDGARLSSLRQQLEEKQAVLEAATMSLEQAQEQQPKQEEERRAAQALLSAETTALAQLEARLSALQQLQKSVQAQGKVQPWLQRHKLAGLPRLWQKLHISAGWETALESVLRERMSALEIPDLDGARSFFNDAPPARLALFTPGAADTPSAPAPDGLQALIDLLQFDDPGWRASMQDWLRDIFIADDTAGAFADRSRLPDGASFVTRQGHVVSRSSVHFYASDSEQDGLLARQQEIDDITEKQHAQSRLVNNARARAARADAAMTNITQRLQEWRQRVVDSTQAVHSLQIEVMKLSEAQERFHQRGAQIVADLTEIEAQEIEQRQIEAESKARFEQFDIELAGLQESHANGQADYLGKEQQLDAARQRLRELERAAQEAGFTAQSLRHRIDELKRYIATALEQAAQALASMQQSALELKNLDDQAAQAGLQALLDQRAAQERVLADARHELDRISQKLRQHEEARLQSERSLQPQRDRITGLQLKEQAARLNQEQFTEALTGAQADEAALAEKLSDTMQPASLQGEVTRLSNAIAALGAVNLAALDELTAASERQHFLDAQHTDLSEAISTLEDAIRRIDIETRALLQDTFDKVNEHFSGLFPALFGGGQARLVMTGDEILDAGVQVMAQPPGKKNATIHLLSGGEKALTATALVFSLFQLNPAPFCLLDEVDAPLDDANTGRFCDMVKRMSSNTQFLFISHNKIAMEMAAQLIGVTMQEQGVSRIVAVDMQAATTPAFQAA